jgi:hypothetical protein
MMERINLGSGYEFFSRVDIVETASSEVVRERALGINRGSDRKDAREAAMENQAFWLIHVFPANAPSMVI